MSREQLVIDREGARLRRYIWLLILFWTAAICVSVSWNLFQLNRSTEEMGRIQARVAFEKDVLYRRWNALHGGAYAAVDDETLPNPYLDVPERDIQTTSGRLLTLINPAYMTRQVHELGVKESGVQGHITSLNPIRPENAADRWERIALQAFEEGETEVSAVLDINGVTTLRLMRPLMTEASCLRCHAVQGYEEGDIRGGISVSIPMSPLEATAQRYVTSLAWAHGVLWSLGLLGIGLGGRRLDRGIRERNRAEDALRESNRLLEKTLAELEEAQERMMRQERLAAVGQLAAGIAHDFNNILASIVLYTQLSLRAPDVPAEIRKRLGVIGEQADLAADLVQQMLDFGRKAIIARRPFSLSLFLKEVVDLLERSLPESVRISLDCGTGEHIINADRTRVQRAIANLARNAHEAMPRGGELHIALSRATGDGIECVTCGQIVEGEWVRMTVTDTGAGIPPDVLPRIFEPFFTTRAPLGSGLGLAQVYGIVKQHGGHIGVETRVGHGTTFALYWPLFEEG